MPESPSRSAPVAVVAVASWLLPGLGYFLSGERVRGLVAGLTIILMYTFGLLIGGVRVIETPGYGDHGQRLMVVQSGAGEQINESTGESEPAEGTWVMEVHPIDELRNKPWNIPQVLVGPIHLAACWGSVLASRPAAAGSTQPIGVRSHARTNEIGSLFAAVAGMLNLLVIIDASSRAAENREER
ncbi:MAG TPA: DUF6677 family protein [Tepidisphaeraceae bacterium]|nr:DUF6677 family protein [Tepidisphaeraceae bacterium]